MLTDWDQKLSKGDRSPYNGVLVPYDSYRYYQQDSLLFPDCNKRLKLALDEGAKAEPIFTKNVLIALLLGGLAGFTINK